MAGRGCQTAIPAQILRTRGSRRKSQGRSGSRGRLYFQYHKRGEVEMTEQERKKKKKKQQSII